MPFLTLFFSLSVFAISITEEDFGIRVSFKTEGKSTQLVLTSELPISEESDRIQLAHLAEIYSFSRCGGQKMIPEVKMQELLPAEKKVITLTRNFECSPGSEKLLPGYLRMIEEECSRKNVFPKMEEACAQARPHVLALKK